MSCKDCKKAARRLDELDGRVDRIANVVIGALTIALIVVYWPKEAKS
jgi:hypothetical protein